MSYNGGQIVGQINTVMSTTEWCTTVALPADSISCCDDVVIRSSNVLPCVKATGKQMMLE